MFKVLRQEFRVDTGPIKTVAADVHRGSRITGSDKPVLMIFFVGETVRSKNFGLSLEAPKTTPNLVGHDLVYLPNTESCGTLTAVSVPCMFSPLSLGEYTRSAFRGSENLTDVVARAGFNVHWWDNNTGDQNIMRSRDWKKVDRLWDPDVCYTGECTDAIFLPLIRETLDTIEEDTLLILHMIGSHGPAYHLRYMPQRAIFKPTCDTAEFSNCTTKEIVNSYNNSIVETDYVLSETIKLMSASKKADTAMIYVSDHGESLGEGGLYLHGAPKFLAPEEQTKVPFLIWLGRSYQERLGVSHDCLRNYADGPTSHDMLFHSVLGLLDLETVDLRPDLNLTSNCAVKGSVNGA
jgi:lipid A ethanolaminephosphotransferase